MEVGAGGRSTPEHGVPASQGSHAPQGFDSWTDEVYLNTHSHLLIPADSSDFPFCLIPDLTAARWHWQVALSCLEQGWDPGETVSAVLSAWGPSDMCAKNQSCLLISSLLCHLGSLFCHECHSDLVSAIFVQENPEPLSQQPT